MAALCQLNEDYADANIRFYVYGDVDTIYNTKWNGIGDILEGAELMLANNDDRAINCYLVSFAARFCGFNLPYAGIILDKECLDRGSHTWAHELGHNLSLPHPFLGWEGTTYNYNYNTPKILRYDYTLFKDSLITDTTIYDTAIVELVDGSNCEEASDRICDTPPDYLSKRWSCDENGRSRTLQKDYNGVDFRSDGTLYMSYSANGCQTRFSPEEIKLMRATLLYKKAFLFEPTPPEVLEVEEVSQHLLPLEGEEVPINQVYLEWAPPAGATNYVVQISLNKSFSRVKYEKATKEPHMLVTALSVPRKYYWRVFSYGLTDYCSDKPPVTSFVGREPVKVKDHTDRSVTASYFSSPGIPARIRLSSDHNDRIRLRIYDILGRPLTSSSYEIHKGEQTLPYHSNYNGWVIVQIRTQQGEILYNKIQYQY